MPVRTVRIAESRLPWSISSVSEQNHLRFTFCNKQCEEKSRLICPQLSDGKFSVLQEIGLVMWSMAVRWQRINQLRYLVPPVTGYLQRCRTALELYLRREVTVHKSTSVFDSYCIKKRCETSIYVILCMEVMYGMYFDVGLSASVEIYLKNMSYVTLQMYCSLSAWPIASLP
jgi:hypothetical protein